MIGRWEGDRGEAASESTRSPKAILRTRFLQAAPLSPLPAALALAEARWSMPEKKKKILVVDDDSQELRLLAGIVSDSGAEVLMAGSGAEALRVVVREEPRIVITNRMMPEMDGLELCRALRNHEGIRFVYVIVVTAHAEREVIVEALDAGADECLMKPVNPAELLARLRAADRIVSLESDLAKRTRELYRANAEMALAHQQLNQANEKLKQMATTDELTGLFNRREAVNLLQEFWEAQDRYGQTFSCIVFDIDHFKRFNDTHGHAAGDFVLKTSAAWMRKNTRKTDKLCRVGGEEFLVLCPNVGVDGAAVCAEHLRAALEQQTFKFQGTDLCVTISLGVAQRTAAMDGPDDLLKAADDALYISKAAGRNRVTVVEQDSAAEVTAAE